MASCLILSQQASNMNRRDFLHKTGAAAIIAAGLPPAIRNQNVPSRYKTELKPGIAGQWYYEIGIFHSSVEHFRSATDDEKVIGLKINYYDTTDQAKPSQTGEYRYIISGTELISQADNTWKINTKLDKKVSGDHKFSRDYPKNLVFQCKPLYYVNILDKKDVAMITVPYPPAGSAEGDDEDCFLTTACVKHKGFADDCSELETLRYLRDAHMAATEEGKMLISQYKITGPEIVNAINHCRNKEEIYEYMHRYMILPSMQLIKQGRYEEAKIYYKTFVQALKEAYC
jgi:hypothetical protein